MIFDSTTLASWLQAMKRNDYAVFERGRHPYNLNIIGFRSEEQVLGEFNDWISVVWQEKSSQGRLSWNYRSYRATTLPGPYYLINRLLNRKGCAILKPGQYRGAYALGEHKGTKALVQRKPVSVYRDNNRDEVFDLEPRTLDTGVFGINIHQAGEHRAVEKVGKHSAGCQVFQGTWDFASFYNLCEAAVSGWGNSLTYTLLEEKDMREI